MARAISMPIPRPSGPRKTVRQQLDPLVAYWSLRLLIKLRFWQRLSGYPDALTFDGELLRTLGLGRYEDQEMTPSAFLRLMKERLQVLTAKQPELVLESLHGRLQRDLGLSQMECRILTLVLALCAYPPFTRLTDEFGEIPRSDAIAAIAAALAVPVPAVRKALSPEGYLARSGLLRISLGGADNLAEKFLPLDGLDALLFEARISVATLTRRYFAPAPRPTLKRSDYQHLEETLNDLLAYLQGAQQRREPGCNVLIYGPPGTGKTELAGVVAQALKRRLTTISSADVEGDAISDAGRIGAYQLAQQTLSRQPDSLILFDEVESLLAFSWLGALFETDLPTANKGFTNQLLATNPVPALWIANDIEDMDPAYVRRFDLVIEMPVPPQSVRVGIANRALDDLGVSESFVQALARQPAIAPAHLTRAARVVRLCTTGTSSHARGKDAQTRHEAQLNRLLSGTLKALGHATPLVTGRSAVTAYRADLLNPDRPIEPVLRGLAQNPQGRLCLYGPPGTGKSAFAAEVARRLERPLLSKRASDLLGAYVGQTEQAIAAMFAEARADQAILLLDEADSFLRSRTSAQQSWEVTQVNELLTQMEAFDGLFICTTNLVEQLDAASLRRFDLKLRFDPLRSEQRLSLFAQVLREQGVANLDEERWRGPLASLDALTPGDFAAVIRQLRIEQADWTPELLLERLRGECEHKRQGQGRPIGFAASF
ncbi:MAG: AAA family ATPase [Lamprobacter sp.]|uniref:AAA family ATPase n=1 Tax=Lamprobacter sp. TaxID=3100796 RepID=UPI002B26414C|nr:AAA family ATPase [Lamprobacter sp.]MEA3642968.1 AAA family ATPase [Lamprobacter sp.]